MSALRETSATFERVSILGASLDVGNRGVTALGESVASLILDLAPSARVAFHYYAAVGGRRQLADGEVSVFNCRLSPRSRPAENIGVILAVAALYRLGVRSPARRNPWLSALLDASFIADIRGGDSLSDIYGLRRFLVGSLPLLSVLILGRPYVLLPQTYGPFRTRTARWLAAMMLRRASDIWTRDRRSIPIAEAVAKRTPRVSPDVAFTLSPVEPRALSFDPPDVRLDAAPLLVGLNVSGLLYMGGYTGRNMFGLRSSYQDTVNGVVSALLERTPATIVVIPHTFGIEMEDEASAAILESTRDAFPGRVVLLKSTLRAREVKWLIGRTHFFIGSRMHACIGALSQHVPTVGLGYSDKFLGVFESAGVGDAVVDLRRHDAEAVTREVLRLLECRDRTASRLAAHVQSVQRQVRQAFADMASMNRPVATHLTASAEVIGPA